MRAATSSVPSFSSEPRIASIEPCTSPLMTSGNSLRPEVLSCAHHLLERAAHAGLPRGRLLALLAGAIVGDLAGAGFGLDHGEAVAGFRRAVEAEHLDRHRRAGRDRRSRPVSEISARTRPHSAPATTMSPACSVPRCTSTVATGPRPRSSLASITVPSAGRFGLALRSSTSACSAIMSSSLSRLVFFLAETSTSSDVAAERFDLDFVLQQFGAHALRLGVGLVDLVDGDDDRHLRRLGVVDRFDRLRHHAVIGGDHQHDDVGDLGAARAHRGEGRVARRIDEGDLVPPDGEVT